MGDDQGADTMNVGDIVTVSGRHWPGYWVVAANDTLHEIVQRNGDNQTRLVLGEGFLSRVTSPTISSGDTLNYRNDRWVVVSVGSSLIRLSATIDQWLNDSEYITNNLTVDVPIADLIIENIPALLRVSASNTSPVSNSSPTTPDPSPAFDTGFNEGFS